MKNDNFKWHAFSLTIIPLAIGIIVGLFIKSTVNDKYITLLVGLLAAIFAFLGVIYSKNKEREIKELEFKNKEKEEKEKLFYQKKEEIYIEVLNFRNSFKNSLKQLQTRPKCGSKPELYIDTLIKHDALIDYLKAYQALYNIGDLASIEFLQKAVSAYIDFKMNNALGETKELIENLKTAFQRIRNSIAKSEM